MYYILNETHQVIAADDNFLTYCDVGHINELSVKIAKGDIEFEVESDQTITIRLDTKEEHFTISKTTLSSLLGNLTLINISSDIENEDEIESTSILEDEPNTLIESIINEEDENTLLDEIASVIDEEDKITFDTPLVEDDDIMSLKKEVTSSEISDTPSTVDLDLPDNEELFNLVLDDTPLSAETDEVSNTDDIPLDLELKNDDNIDLDTPKEEDLSEIHIDSEKISAKIGISNDDYKNFLNDFIDTALSLEKDLQSQNDDTRSDAVNTLSHLSDVLHLPFIGDILSNIKGTDTQREDIESLYSTLSRITTQESNEVLDSEETPTIETSDIENLEIEDEKIELFDEPIIEPKIQETVTPRNAPKGNSFGTISLEGIKPKHFDFQLEEAANDLSLPIELIEEFVNDFIDQAHIETKKMLQAYEDGDLDAIQKIGHLLKGASSNLRINPLSDTLYKIQFCEDPKNLDLLIKDYWAHFLSFETQINAISH